MKRREFLMLAKDWDPSRSSIGGWWMSEKLDGQRAFWDGGITAGMPASEVPWANVAADGRYVRPPTATGLWSRYGKVIHAPAWWLKGFPAVPVDMELFAGRGRHQWLRTVVAPLEPTADWEEVEGRMLDLPGWRDIVEDGTVKAPAAHWEYDFKYVDLCKWVSGHGGQLSGSLRPDEAYARMSGTEFLVPHEQTKLPREEKAAREQIEGAMDEILSKRGEGLVLRDPTERWSPHRSRGLLKVKRAQDAEGVVVGFTWGRETDRGSRHLGRMGALVLEYRGKRLELSGFTDAERAVEASPGRNPECKDGLPLEATANPGKDASLDWQPACFPRGTVVTFSFREHTDAGLPKEARYFRVREQE